MEINLTTVQDKKRLIGFSDYCAKSKKAYWIYSAVCTFLVLAADMFLYTIDALSFELIGFAVLVVIIDLVTIATYWIVPRIAIKKALNVDSVLTYSFRDDEALFTAEAMDMKSSGSFK